MPLLLPYSDQVLCPRAAPGREHDARMEWATTNGVRTGRLVAWCHTCHANVDDLGTREVRISDAERRPECRVSESGERRDQIARNNAILDAWRTGTAPTDIGHVFGLSRERVSQIVRRRSA